MAQQTINIGASPNDGTGTPLRTAFQYTNSNFSELYTALGGGSGLPGATTQVIFNDGGTNLAGDAGLVYNKTTDALTIGGNVQAASATITGDLTVDTSTLKVDSANNRVGIGTASPASALDVYGETRVRSGNQLRVYRADNAIYSSIEDAGSGVGLSINNVNGDGFLLKVASNNVYQVGNSYVQTWFDGAGGTRMTLNSTGLGVGGSPSGNTPMVLVEGIAGTYAKFNSKVGAKTWSAGYRSGTLQYEIQEDGTERFVIANGGNLGIGVTPSAWSASYKVIDVAGGGGITALSNGLYLASNGYENGGWKKKGAGYANLLLNASGEYRFYVSTAGAGAANDPITFTQAMTLDASGNLLVGKAASSSTVVGAELRPSGAIISTLAASTNADFALYTYSTGAGAARFYVGMSGTVFATNTTISAISDARLKENVQDIDVGLGAILALKPRKFDWKEGKGKDIKGDRGFIAQEFEQVFPQLVDEWADPAPEGEAPYKSVRQDLIPVLVKAIQELTARVQTLEAK